MQFVVFRRNEKCRKHRVYGTFGVFSFLLTSGTIVQQSSQENKIQNLSQQPTACRKSIFDTLNRPEHRAVFFVKKIKFLKKVLTNMKKGYNI